MERTGEYNGADMYSITMASVDSSWIYQISYDDNAATSGTVPLTQTKERAISITLATNAGLLAKTGFVFTGWNTAAAGSGTDYAEGATYSTDASMALFAKWASTYPVTYDGNGETSGTEPAAQTKVDGVTLTLQSNTGILARTGYTFGGWNTQADGLGTAYEEGASYTANAPAVLHSLWILPFGAILTLLDASGSHDLTGTSGTRTATADWGGSTGLTIRNFTTRPVHFAGTLAGVCAVDFTVQPGLTTDTWRRVVKVNQWPRVPNYDFVLRDFFGQVYIKLGESATDACDYSILWHTE
jgi:hypothetical protein